MTWVCHICSGLWPSPTPCGPVIGLVILTFPKTSLRIKSSGLLWGGLHSVYWMLFPPRCISFARQAGSEIFASFPCLLTSSLLACSARPRASHGFLCRRSGNLLLLTIAWRVRRGPHTNGRPGDRTSTSPTLPSAIQLRTNRASAPSGAFGSVCLQHVTNKRGGVRQRVFAARHH